MLCENSTQKIKIQVYPVSSTQVQWLLTVTYRARVDLEKKNVFQASEYLQPSGVKRGMLLHWKQCGEERENADGRRGECYEPWGEVLMSNRNSPWDLGTL